MFPNPADGFCAERVSTGSARRRRERRLRSMLRHERMSVAMALAAATHHSALRGEWRDLYEAPRGQRTESDEATNYALRSQTTSVARDAEFFSLYEEELGGTRPDRLSVVRPQDRYSGTLWSRSSTARWSCRRLMFPCRRGRTSWWRRASTWTFRSPNRLSKCPRSRLHPVPPAGTFALRSRRWNSWWKCRRLYPILRYVGFWSRTWTFQFLMIVEVVSVSEVFKVSQDRVQQRFLEQISQQRLPSRTLSFQFRVVTELFILH